MCKHQQLGLDGEWHDMDEVTGKSEPLDFEDNFDVCPVCGNNPCTCGDECPLGGDLNNDCADCFYRADYHYDKETGDCLRNDD